MAEDFPLSQHLQSYIDTLDWERKRDTPPEEREEAKESERIIKLIVDDIISSRETLSDNKLATVEKLFEETPNLIGDLLDERFTRDVIDAVPGYVKRLLELSRLQGSAIPSKITNGYLREAVRTYIFGFSQASIALSRAALEQALKEELGHQSRKLFIEMKDLLDEAEGAGVIDGVIRKAARKIATEADDVLHEKPADLKKAYEVLLNLRGVLQHIFSA